MRNCVEKNSASAVREFFFHLRYPQLFFHFAALFLGALTAVGFFTPDFARDGLSPGAAPAQLADGLGRAALLAFAAAAGWVFAVTLNDAEDIRADRISNPRRPLPRGLLSRRFYLSAASVAPAAALAAAGALGREIFLTICGYLLVNLLYNLPPRLKNFPFLGTLAAAFGLQLILLAGFSLYAPLERYPFGPGESFFLVLIASLIMVAKDFKDIAGDRAAGTLTVPIWLGEKAAAAIVLIGLGGFFSVLPAYVPGGAFLGFGGGIFWLLSAWWVFSSLSAADRRRRIIGGIFALLAGYFALLAMYWWVFGYLSF